MSEYDDESSGGRPTGERSQRPPEGRRPAGPRDRQQPERPADPFDYESIFTPGANDAIPLKDRLNRIPRKAAIRTGIAVFVVIVLVVVGNTVKHMFVPSGTQGPQVNVTVANGTTLSGIATQLEGQKVVPSALGLRVWAKITRQDDSFRAGEYAFHSNSSDTQALRVLHNGPKKSTDVLTVPEGKTIRDIGQIIGNLPGMSSVKFMQIANSNTIRSDYEPADVTSLEGFLYPDTYFIAPTDNENTLIQRMVNEFDTQVRRLNLARSQQTVGRTPYETLTIASLIEAEAKVPQDRGKISQVIENRLYRAMPLQIDASVIYSLQQQGINRRKLTNSDLKLQSPWNTYVIPALPQTPICSPGQASLTAALQPTPGDWLYYVVADNNGAHAFASTKDEHDRNVEAAKKKGLL